MCHTFTIISGVACILLWMMIYVSHYHNHQWCGLHAVVDDDLCVTLSQSSVASVLLCMMIYVSHCHIHQCCGLHAVVDDDLCVTLSQSSVLWPACCCG